MSEAPLYPMYPMLHPGILEKPGMQASWTTMLQEYLAHKKQRPLRTLLQACSLGRMVALGRVGCFL